MDLESNLHIRMYVYLCMYEKKKPLYQSVAFWKGKQRRSWFAAFSQLKEIKIKYH